MNAPTKPFAITFTQVELMRIENAPGLDPIEVIFMDLAPGAGRIILRCWGSAWTGTTLWGAMGDDNDVRAFFLSASANYIAGCLVRNEAFTNMRARDRQEKWVERVVAAVQAAMVSREYDDARVSA